MRDKDIRGDAGAFEVGFAERVEGAADWDEGFEVRAQAEGSPRMSASAGNGIVAAIAASLGTSRGKGWKPQSVSRKLIHYAGCSKLIVRPMERF